MAAPASAEVSCSVRGAGSTFIVPPPDWDWDCDSVPDEIDNCPPIGYDNLATRNPNQANSDLGLPAVDGMPAGDELGDACDEDDDADGVPDFTDGQIDYLSTKVRLDNCRTVRNPDQADENPRNGIGDACQFDTDGDGVFDFEDNCVNRPNPDQADQDGDGAGDACDNDPDGDYVRDAIDNCPGIPNPQVLIGGEWIQPDADGDGIGDACDPVDDRLPPPAPPSSDPPPSGPVPAPGDEPPPAAGGGRPGAADRQPPRVTVDIRTRHRWEEIEDALIVRVRCSEACQIKAEVVVARSLARRVKLRRTTVASGSAAVEAATSTYAFVRFDRAARRALRKRSRAAVTLRVRATDRAGNTRRVSERLTLRR